MLRPINSFVVALVVLAIGTAFVIASFAVGVLNFEVCWARAEGLTTWSRSRVVSCFGPYDLKKQVGFGTALNWSVGMTILFPLFVYCVCETINAANLAIRDMVERGMIVASNWTRAPIKKIESLVARRSRTLLIAVGAVAVLALAFIPLEYFRVVGQFYPDPGEIGLFDLKDIDKEADWSIAGPICRYLGETTGACKSPSKHYFWNGVFAGSGYAYLVYAGVIAAVGFMVGFGLYIRFFFSPELRAAGFYIVPDVESPDKRRGFEALEGFFLHAVTACFVLFAMGYLVTLQNVYLRTDYPDITSLILPFLVEPDGLSVAGLAKAMQGAVQQQLTVVNGNSVAVTILGLLFFMIMVSSAAVALGRTARRGRDRMLAAINGTDVEKAAVSQYLGPLDVTQATAALNNVEFWPMLWPKLNMLIAWLVLAILSLLFVTVGFYLMCIGLAFVVKEAVFKSS